MGGAELRGSYENYYYDISYLLEVRGGLSMVPTQDIHLWRPGSALYC